MTSTRPDGCLHEKSCAPRRLTTEQSADRKHVVVEPDSPYAPAISGLTLDRQRCLGMTPPGVKASTASAAHAAIRNILHRVDPTLPATMATTVAAAKTAAAHITTACSPSSAPSSRCDGVMMRPLAKLSTENGARKLCPRGVGKAACRRRADGRQAASRANRRGTCLFSLARVARMLPLTAPPGQGARAWPAHPWAFSCSSRAAGILRAAGQSYMLGPLRFVKSPNRSGSAMRFVLLRFSSGADAPRCPPAASVRARCRT